MHNHPETGLNIADRLNSEIATRAGTLTDNCSISTQWTMWRTLFHDTINVQWSSNHPAMCLCRTSSQGAANLNKVNLRNPTTHFNQWFIRPMAEFYHKSAQYFAEWHTHISCGPKEHLDEKRGWKANLWMNVKKWIQYWVCLKLKKIFALITRLLQ